MRTRLHAAPLFAAAALIVGCSSPAPISAGPSAGDATSIDLEPLWSVGERPGEEQIVCTTDTMLAATRTLDRFYVGPTCVPGQVAVVDETGSLIETLGVAGQGPGELLPVATIFVDEVDRLHVFQFPRRHTTFDGEHREVMRSDELPLAYWAAFSDGGRSIRNFRRRSTDGVGKPLHRVDDATDEVVFSFGEADGSFDPDDGRALFRSVTWRDGRIWSARHSEYVLEEWSDTGERLRTLRREPEWWVPDANVWDVALREGFLWVVALVPTPEDGSPSADIVVDPALADHMDTVIEVLDPQTGELVAQLRRDEMLFRWVRGLLYSHRNLEDGGVALDLWRVSLSGTPD